MTREPSRVVMPAVPCSCRCVAVLAIRPLPRAKDTIGLKPGGEAYLDFCHLFEDEAMVATIFGNGAKTAMATQFDENVKRHM